MSSDNRASREQIIEIVRQLGNGQMSRDYTQAVIEHRFEPSGVSIRETQAQRLFDLGFGRVLGCKYFDEYLNGTDAVEAIPQIPTFPAEQVRLFGRENIWIVDGRVAEKVGLKEYFRLVGLAYSGKDHTFEPYDPKRERFGVRWMIGQDGYRNRGREANDCRERFHSFEVGMDAIEGGAVYGQNPKVINEHYWMDLPGSVHYECYNACAHLDSRNIKPRISWNWNGGSCPQYGSATRGV